METKICNTCKREFPKTHEYFSFHVYKNGNIYFDYRCKNCAAIYKREKRRLNPEHERNLDRQRHTRDHEKRLKSIRSYNNNHREELVAKNKARRMVMKDQYNKSRREKYASSPQKRINLREWRETHPDKIREYDRNKYIKRRGAFGNHTLQDEKTQRLEQHNRCYWCSRTLIDVKTHVDHIHPLSRGGSNWANNICITCAKCNLSKGARLPYLEWQPPNPLFKRPRQCI